MYFQKFKYGAQSADDTLEAWLMPLWLPRFHPTQCLPRIGFSQVYAMWVESN